MLPIDYFGAFDFEETLLWYDGPLIGTIRGKNQDLYLAYCIDLEYNSAGIWLLVPISNDELQGLKSNRVPLLQCIQVSPLYRVILNWNCTAASITEIDYATLPPDELPQPGIMLHVTKEERQERKSP